MGAAQPRRIEERIAHEVMVAALLLGVALVQTTLLPRPFDSAPNLMLLLVICQALIAGPASAARWALYGGVAFDLCADSILGTHALALLAAVVVPSLLLLRLSRANWVLPLLGVLLGSLAYFAVLALLTWILVAPVAPRAYVLTVLVPAMIMVVVPALPLFLSMRWIEGRRRGEVPVDVY